VLNVDNGLIRRASELIDRFALRAYDSVHLAAAESLLGGIDAANLRFMTFDASLNRAAAELGMSVATT
jgi:predicted nucleic acid-binding protein